MPDRLREAPDVTSPTPARIAADYPGAIWLPAHPSRFRVGDGKTRLITRLVLHVTDGHPEALGTAQMFALAPRPQEAGTSAHFVVGQAGEIYQCVRLDDIAEHAHDANPYSVGIEHSGRTPKEWGPRDPGLALTPVQIEASVALVAWLCEVRKLPRDRAHIQGHAEADPKTTHRSCPEGVRGGWPWDRWVGAPICK